jgi:hypothetical protein
LGFLSTTGKSVQFFQEMDLNRPFPFDDTRRYDDVIAITRSAEWTMSLTNQPRQPEHDNAMKTSQQSRIATTVS